MMGPDFFFQPRRSHPGAHWVMVFTQSRLSVKTRTSASSGSIVNASMSARSSMRLFVVSGSWPCFSDTISPFSTHTTPQPPGPGLGTALPSVKTPEAGPSVYLARASAGVRFSSRRGRARLAPPRPGRGSAAFFRGAAVFLGAAAAFFGEWSRQYFGRQPG